ncbi:unnamed protein product [Rhizophagus irregularis]|nr:unnamed protein product [Rhizophagus irregularis]CAB5388799.1 unnamed protein product [Rhizophagus irregularis]
MPPKGTGRKTTTRKRKNEIESESSPKTTSQKRSKSEVESESSSTSVRRSERIAAQPKRDRQDSDLARIIQELNLTSYGLPSSASGFKNKDIDTMKVIFQGASAENVVIPDAEIKNFPDEYLLADINRTLLRKPNFTVDDLGKIKNGDVLTFIDKLHDITENSTQLIGTSETHTDSLVDDLLRVVGFNTWPLKIKNHEPCSIYIADVPVVSSDAEFVIKKREIFVLVVEHLKNVGHATGYGETQIAVEILACGSTNIRTSAPKDQTLWAIRVISTYVTIYKATIPALYWKELQDGLPKTEVKIERWPAENGLMTGYDLAEPDGRQNALTALIRLRESLLSQGQQGQSSTSHTAVASQGQQGQSSISHTTVASQGQQEQSSTSHIAIMPQDQQELSEPSEQSSKKKGKLREV